MKVGRFFIKWAIKNQHIVRWCLLPWRDVNCVVRLDDAPSGFNAGIAVQDDSAHDTHSLVGWAPQADISPMGRYSLVLL